MLSDDIFALPQEHIEVSGDDHVLDLLLFCKKLVLAFTSYIVGGQPAVFKRLGCNVRKIPVTAGQQQNVETDFARLPLWNSFTVLAQQSDAYEQLLASA